MSVEVPGALREINIQKSEQMSVILKEQGLVVRGYGNSVSIKTECERDYAFPTPRRPPIGRTLRSSVTIFDFGAMATFTLLALSNNESARVVATKWSERTNVGLLNTWNSASPTFVVVAETVDTVSMIVFEVREAKLKVVALPLLRRGPIGTVDLSLKVRTPERI